MRIRARAQLSAESFADSYRGTPSGVPTEHVEESGFSRCAALPGNPVHQQAHPARNAARGSIPVAFRAGK